MPSAVLPVQTATAVTTRTSVKTWLAVATIGAASFAAATFMAGGGPEAKLMIGLSPTATDIRIVEGTDDAVVLNFDAMSRKKDVIIDTLIFDTLAEADGDFTVIDGGLTITDYIMSCSLYQTGLLISGPEPITLGQLAFRGTGALLTKDVINNFEVKCDFIGSSPHTTAYAFALTMPNDTFVTAEDPTGTALIADYITVGSGDLGMNLLPSQQTSLYEHGNLQLHISGSSPGPSMLLPKSTGVELGQWLIGAIGEDMQVQKLSFEMAPSAANNVSLVHLNFDNGTTISDHTVALAGGLANFYISELAYQDIPAMLTLSIDTTPSMLDPGGAGESGEKVQFTLNALDVGSFEAVGMTTGNSFDENDLLVKVASAATIYRYTKPTVSLSILSPAGVAIPGVLETLRFNLSADSAGDVQIKSFTFELKTTDNAMSDWNSCPIVGIDSFVASDFSLYNLTTGAGISLDTSDLDWSLADTAGAACSIVATQLGFVTITLPAPLIIPAGTTHTFTVEVDTTGASSASDDSFRLDIPGNILGLSGLIWGDGGTVSLGGSHIDSLPINGNTLVF